MHIRQFVSAVIGLWLVLSGSLAHANAIDDLQRFYSDTRSLQTEFRQLQIDESGTVSKTQEGRFWMQRPDRLRWVYERPYRQVLVNDGQRFWLYDEDLAQVTVRPSDQALQNAPMLLLSGGPQLTQQFELKALSDAQGMAWVDIRPRAEEADFVSAQMGMQNGQPAVLELRDSLGQRTRILFLNLQRNLTIDSARFQFKVPDGVEVIGAESAG